MQKFIKQFYSVSEVAYKARPFSIRANPGSDSLVIIIHGFTSSPYRLHFMSDFLAGHGFDIETVLLAGHGGSLENLANSGADDWYRSVEEVLVRNIKKYKNIFLLGYSFGANIAIHLAREYPQVKAIVSLGIPVFLKKERAIRLLLPLVTVLKKKYRKGWISRKEAPKLAERGHHTHIPIKCVVEFCRFIDNYTKKEINSLQIPVLIIHSRHDLVSHPKSSEFLYRNLPQNNKSLFVLNKGDHQLENGARKDFITNKVLDFVSN